MGRVDTGRVAVRGEAASHNYASEWIAQLARAIRDWRQPAETWCIFDNTASVRPDELASRIIDEAAASTVRVIANRPDRGDVAEYEGKLRTS